MQRQFSITTPAQSVSLSAGRADILFTVANLAEVAVRGMAKIVPLGATRADWLVLAGDNEREFPTGAIHQFTVAANVPPDVATGRYTFRIDVISARKSGEELTESPVVTLDVEARAVAAKRSMSWIAYAAAAFFLVIGVSAYLMMRTPEQPVPASPPVTHATTTPGAVAHAVPVANTTTDVPPPPDQTASVPAVIGLQWSAAKKAIEHASLVAVVGETEPKFGSFDHRMRGEVTNQMPIPGMTVKRGSTVSVKVLGSAM